MTARVTLTGDYTGASSVIGGVEFLDGVAEGVELGPHSRGFFEMLGAEIEDDVLEPTVPMTEKELRSEAKRLGITVPKGASREAIAALLDAHEPDPADTSTPPPDGADTEE